jgi:hypothetical protein
MTLATWHARSRALEAVAALANAAHEAASAAPGEQYTREYAAELERLRQRLVATAREAEPREMVG